MKKHNTPTGFVYLIQRNGLHGVKIGYSGNPLKRLRELSVGSPEKLFLIATWQGTRADEQELHTRFNKHRLEGEWFAIDAHIATQWITIFMAGAIGVTRSKGEIEVREMLDRKKIELEISKQQTEEMRQHLERAISEREQVIARHNRYREQMKIKFGLWLSLGIALVLFSFILGYSYWNYSHGRRLLSNQMTDRSAQTVKPV